MKRAFFILAAALLLAACTGKDGDQSIKVDWGDDQLMAVGFLGYYDSVDSFRSSDGYQSLEARYPWVADAQEVGPEEGTALCLVLPRYASSSVKVSQYTPQGTKKVRGKVYDKVYLEGDGAPFLLRCNLDDPAVSLMCTDSTGAEVSYIPAMLGDGTLYMPDSRKVADISMPVPEPDPSLKTASYTEGFGISAGVRAGQPYLHMDSHSILGMGVVWTEDDLNMSDGMNVASGVNGICKGVYIADIGQDYNPVLCALMADGSVKVLTIFDSLHSGETRFSCTIAGISDIVGFESGGAGRTADGGFSYRTIYAIDSHGRSHEVPLFLGRSDEYYRIDEAGNAVNVGLSQDWKLSYEVSSPEGRLLECHYGTFQEISSTDDERFFVYSVPGGEGSFKIRYTDEYTDIIVGSEGLITIADTSVFHPGSGPADDIEFD